MATRASSRQAAQKAKEAITDHMGASGSGKDSAGSKRKARSEKPQEPNKQREIEKEPKVEDSAGPSTGGMSATKPVEQRMPGGVTGTQHSTEKREDSDLDKESGVRKSDKRESIVPSSILEKGIIYFFFRPRVNVDDPHGMSDVARSFFVLRPTPLGAELDNDQGPVDKDARCRLLMLPKKKFPTSAKERDMAFVEKAGQSVRDLQDKFVASSTYQTATRGERTTEDARPYAEGVYAITSTQRASHLAYELTIPAELGEIQKNFGLCQRGSWIVQSKNPKFPGPPQGQLPKEADYPESVREKFGDLRWVPLQPEFIDYPNAQILMIGAAMNNWGKAATAEGTKQPDEPEPGQELERLAEENEHRVEHLQGNETVFQDLGMYANNYRGLPTTWS
ncbi:uncharacterized protein N7484_007255, partial [Penicillium longicatenatum]|uniref:uncharacterized protein n=1 Tax=Penicillium longicatenatum TaxID=1561947 RepID=UPI00254852C1